MENYRLIGGISLDDDLPINRVLIVLNNKDSYFEDTKTYNAFVRIRREHMKKIIAKKVVEIDFYEVTYYCLCINYL